MTKRIVLTLSFALYAGAVIATPIRNADIVTVEGKQWAQPGLFGWAEWGSINAVCPNQICRGILSTSFSGSLDMDGWIWASMADATSLLNSYGVSLAPELGSAIWEIDSDWAPAFFANGWRDTGQGGGLKLVEGLVADSECASLPPYPSFPCKVSIYDRDGVSAEDNANIYAQISPYFTTGAWFYRDANQVPAPATLAILSLGLAGLGISRRKRAARV